MSTPDPRLHDDDASWEAFLDEEARAAFWWPTDAEVRDWKRRWFRTPVETRFSDPTLRYPWTFGSVIDAARDGEFAQLACRATADGGAIEFTPLAAPFGGTGWMRALIEAFGGRVLVDTTS